MNASTVITVSVGRFDPAGELRKAIDPDEFVLYYQPQLNYAGKLQGAEALIRWRHAARGMVFPTNFIALAEESCARSRPCRTARPLRSPRPRMACC